MRAIEGNHRVSTWRKLAGITAASALAVSVLAGTAQAAVPGWPAGHGTNYLAPAESGASSTFVTAGNTVGFYEWLHNPGPSNISQLFLNVADIAPPTTAGPLGAQVGVAWTIQNDSGTVLRNGTCTINTTPLCSFGALNAGQTVYVVAAFKTLAAPATQGVRFDFNSTGIPPGGNKSHGDDVFVSSTVQISSASDLDAAGDFNFNQAAGLTIATAAIGAGGGAQSTSVTVGPQVGAFVGDGPSVPAAKCTKALIADIVAQNPWFSCNKLTSLTSAIEVGNGRTFKNANGGPGLKVIISFAAAPNQLNGAHPFAYHVDASGTSAELITALCNLDANGVPTVANPSEGCLLINGNSVTAWVFHNGGMRY